MSAQQPAMAASTLSVLEGERLAHQIIAEAEAARKQKKGEAELDAKKELLVVKENLENEFQI